MLLITLMAMLAVLAVMPLVYWAMGRWLGNWGRVVTGFVLLGYMVFEWVRLRNFCAAPPRWVAPTPEAEAAGSDGGMIFNCDSAGGVADDMYLYLFGPFLIFLFSLLFLRDINRLRTPHVLKAEAVK